MRLRIMATFTERKEIHGIAKELYEFRSPWACLMDRDTRNGAIGALSVLLLFGIAAYWLPSVMLAVGSVSTVLAGVVAAVFMVALFVVFWLRGRSQRKKGL